MSDSTPDKRRTLTERLAPLRVLNRVAVTTRRFCGSTAPTATSGVSTTPTSFGGAVSTAARPKNSGVPGPGDGLTGVMGVVGLARFSDSRPFAPLVEAPAELYEFAIELRRPGVAYDVDRVSEARDMDDTVRGAGAGLSPGVCGVIGRAMCCGLRRLPLVPGCLSSSVHWRCRIMDLVAHYM